MLKRASFATIGPTAFNAPSANILGPKKDRKKESTKTVRVEIKLTQPTRESYCEYSYPELSHTDVGQGVSNDPLDPFASENDDDNLKRIAKKFNEKYGPKRSKYSRLEDYIDKGAGYDDSDSFINNDEAYDELVPSTLTTVHDGFYINTGKLEFKPVDELGESEEEDEDDEDEKGDEDGDSDIDEVKHKVSKVSFDTFLWYLYRLA